MDVGRSVTRALLLASSWSLYFLPQGGHLEGVDDKRIKDEHGETECDRTVSFVPTVSVSVFE